MRRMVSLHLKTETFDALLRSGVPRLHSIGGAISTALDRLERLSQLAPLETTLGRGFYEFALEVLVDPWGLTASDIQALPSVLRGVPGITAAAHARGFDLSAFLVAIESLRYADRIALVDRAQQFRSQT